MKHITPVTEACLFITCVSLLVLTLLIEASMHNYSARKTAQLELPIEVGQ